MPYQDRDRQWNRQANCRGVPTHVFFPPTNSWDGVPVGPPFKDGREKQNSFEEARKVCAVCPVRDACLSAALSEESGSGKAYIHGMRGGMTPDERWRYVRQLRRRSA